MVHGCDISLLLADGESPHFLGANYNKKVNSMKKADKPGVFINVHVYGDNNKVSLNENCSHISATVIGITLTTAAVLAVSHCCPELLPDIVRYVEFNPKMLRYVLYIKNVNLLKQDCVASLISPYADERNNRVLLSCYSQN